MKYKNIYRTIVIVVSTLVLTWAIPTLVRLATATAQDYPFVYYSSLLQDYAIREKGNEAGESILRDAKGNVYNRHQFDSITPLLNYRQLTLSGDMPDSIRGVAIDANLMKMKSIYWRFTPKDINHPVLPLYLMYESMSGRADLEIPNDIFRLKDNIEFISILDNKVMADKSNLFVQALLKKGFTFPAKEVWGNVTNRKPYDEGYFVKDNNGLLFHLKMVNGKPYVHNTGVGEQFDVAYMTVQEVPDKSIYGFVVSTEGNIYALNTVTYDLVKFDIDPINIQTDNFSLMGNPLYWMAFVTTPNNAIYNVLEANTLKRHIAEPMTIDGKVNKWDVIASYIFPIYFQFDNKTTDYIVPSVKLNIGFAILFSILLAVVYIFTSGRKKTTVQRIINFVLIAIFGIPAYVVALIIK